MPLLLLPGIISIIAGSYEKPRYAAFPREMRGGRSRLLLTEVVQSFPGAALSSSVLWPPISLAYATERSSRKNELRLFHLLARHM